MDLAQTHIQQKVAQVLAEDIGSGDLTASLIADNIQASAKLIVRESAILCGIAWFNECFKQLDEQIQIHWKVSEGSLVTADSELCILKGRASNILSAERVALNFLQSLSGTATMTHQYVEKVKSYRAVILDTRKTLPGLRYEQKYACRIGGAQNHRMGLYDAILIKENHIHAHGSIKGVLQKAQETQPNIPLEIEVENLHDLRQALEGGAQRILLDNFSLSQLSEAVQINQGKAKLEASGGIDLDNVMEIAKTGVDYISIGGLTKHMQAIDFSLLVQMP